MINFEAIYVKTFLKNQVAKVAKVDLSDLIGNTHSLKHVELMYHWLLKGCKCEPSSTNILDRFKRIEYLSSLLKLYMKICLHSSGFIAMAGVSMLLNSLEHSYLKKK